MDRCPITENTLFYGDNLKILREYIASECVDLIYLDPPFNSIVTITFYLKTRVEQIARLRF
jgi:16S rRNA G966 N2-methylase RsmD